MKPEELKQVQQDLEKQRENSKKPLHLNKKIEDDIITNEYSKSEKPFNVFSPSQVGYCRRQMYNMKMNIKEMDRYVQGILHQGTVNHFFNEYKLPSLIEDRALTTERKFRKRIDLPEADFDIFVSGYADAVDSDGYVYDHKFTKNTNYAKDLDKKTKDKRQVMMYLYCLPNIHTGRLEYVTRDGKFGKDLSQPYIIEHRVEFDPEEFHETLENMKAVAKAVKEREGTEKEVINPFDRCEQDGGDPCFYCENDHKDFRDEVIEELKEKNEWSAQRKA